MAADELVSGQPLEPQIVHIYERRTHMKDLANYIFKHMMNTEDCLDHVARILRKQKKLNSMNGVAMLLMAADIVILEMDILKLQNAVRELQKIAEKADA